MTTKDQARPRERSSDDPATAKRRERLTNKASPHRDHAPAIENQHERQKRILELLARGGRLSEQEVQDALKLLLTIIDRTPSVIFLKDLHGRYQLANRTFGTVIGANPQDIIGKTDYDLFPKDLADQYREVDLEAVRTGSPLHTEEQGPHEKPYFSVKFPLLDRQGAAYALAGIVTDISVLKRAEAELQERLRFERLLYELSAAFIDLPTNDVDATINETLRRLGEFMDVDRCVIDQFSEDKREFRVTHFWALGSLRADRFMGKVLLNEQLPWYTARMLSAQSLIFTGIDELPDEAVPEKAYIQSVGIKSSAIVPLIVDGDVIGNIGVDAIRSERVWPESFIQSLKAIGEIIANALVRKRSEKMLLAAKREAAANRAQLAHLTRVQIVGEMGASIAHEVNQPLAAIENYAQACKRRLDTEAVDRKKLAELVEKITAQAHRAGSVLTRVRAMVKRQPVNMMPADLNSIIQETVELATMEAQLHDCRIHVELTPSLPAVVVDRIEIQQVTLNLIRNAIEATHAAGRGKEKVVVVKTGRKSADELEVCVADYGLGVTDVEGEHIFEAFYSTKRSGLGMGLSLCRTIVSRHGGEIWRSRGPSAETLFHFSLPVDTEESAG